MFSTFTSKGGRPTLAAFVRETMSVPWAKAKTIVEGRMVRIGGMIVADPAFRLKAGLRIEITHPDGNPAGSKVVKEKPAPEAPRPKRERTSYLERWKGPRPEIVYQDEVIVVVDKPAGLTTNRSADDVEEFGEKARKFLPVTLVDILPEMLGEPVRPVIAVHRIDRDTTGLVVFARGKKAERDLLHQFREHSIERRYVALIRGTTEEKRIESHLIRDRGDGRRGSSGDEGQGQRAVTFVRVIEEFPGYAMVECRLETGRTHQVRIHLGESGAPLCGEKVYDRPKHGQPLSDPSGATRTCLHAWHLGLTHPRDQNWMEWTLPLPPDMKAVLEVIRGETAAPAPAE